eukprot:6431853-Alexandrium_andersonii.AAC.1
MPRHLQKLLMNPWGASVTLWQQTCSDEGSSMMPPCLHMSIRKIAPCSTLPTAVWGIGSCGVEF